MEVTPSRLETFSDGVLAIAITLLILEIRVDVDGQSLARALLEIWPSYLAYVTSFLTIGIIWINHHAIFDLAVKVDRPILFLNTLLLMAVAFSPFPTRLVAEFLREGHDERTAALAYGLTFVVMAILFQAIWRLLSWRRRCIRPDVPQETLDAITRSFNPGIAIYAGATAIAFVSPLASVLLYLAIAVFYALPATLIRRRRSPGSGRG